MNGARRLALAFALAGGGVLMGSLHAYAVEKKRPVVGNLGAKTQSSTTMNVLETDGHGRPTPPVEAITQIRGKSIIGVAIDHAGFWSSDLITS